MVVASAMVLAGVAGCSQETPGRPVADTTGTSTTSGSGSSSAPRTTSSGPGGGGSLATLDPCDLLSAESKTALGVTGAPKPEEFPSSKLCQWRVNDNPTVPDGFSLGVAVFPESGIDRVNATGEKVPVTVGARRAVRSSRSGGSVCAISLEVTATSRVDVQASGSGDPALCTVAMEAAEVVEPGLP